MLQFPEKIPRFENPLQQIPVLTPDGNRSHIALNTLETLLTPTLFCLPGRPAVITPILKKFATPLFGHSPQTSFLPNMSAATYLDRHYLSDKKTLRHFEKGPLILFYESSKQGGSSAIIAIARVREAFLKEINTLETQEFDQSVLTQENVQEIGKSLLKTVTLFDNIFLLPRPVSLPTLKNIGCGKPTQLITTNRITDEQLQSILAEGFHNE